MKMPKFMKLITCTCGHKVYSKDGTSQECKHCNKRINYYG